MSVQQFTVDIDEFAGDGTAGTSSRRPGSPIRTGFSRSRICTGSASSRNASGCSGLLVAGSTA